MRTEFDPPWLAEARKHIGTRETKGPAHEPKIVAWWRAIKRGGIKDDETPWCAAFVGAMLESAGVTSSRFESAKSYLSWGVALLHPVPGCVVVFARDGGGHVGFVVGRDPLGRLLVLGGNQGDEVNVRTFPLHRVTGYRWPASVPMTQAPLPIMAAAQLSGSEA
jgi:uncharacterized protein (TIGR02594 family)